MKTILGAAVLLSASMALAKGGSTINVTATASVIGTVVQGGVTIVNAGTKTLTVQAMSVTLEVRYPSGTTPPALPPGVTSEYYRVAMLTLTPPASVPGLGSVTVPYTIDTCNAQVARFYGAKDIRAVGFVTIAGRAYQGRSANVTAPAQSTCPVCGNGRRETGEQCDGTSCCTSACVFATDGSACSDANACTRVDQCVSGACVGTDPIVCVASDQCHVAGTCSPTTGGCSNPNKANGTPCNDGNACSTSDACTSGICSGRPVVCNDTNPCTSDGCVAGTCVFTPNTAPCEDGSVCTEGGTCGDGLCQPGTPIDCTDHRVCTDDACVEGQGCTHEPTATCDGCYADECLVCRDECAVANATCSENCWLGFWSCVSGCTSTYCAPFCQVDLGRCLETCPAVATCEIACDAGNGCAAGCTQP